MAYEGLDWQVVNVPFGAGLFQQTDDRARPAPYLDIASDIQFDEQGGIQGRLPFGAPFGSIFGGGTIANARRIERNGTETVLFTDTAVYSWNEQLAKWVLRGTHLAVAVDEKPRFATSGDQVSVDRAELNSTIVYTWTEGTNPLATQTVYVAAIDKTTGNVLMNPTGVAGSQSRVVALATKILFFLHEAPVNNLTVRALDPANPAAGFAAAATSIVAANMRTCFDVVRVLGADQAVGACQMATTTTYTAFTVTAGLTVVTSLKARTSDGRICVASRPSAGTQTHVFRSVSATTAIQGDVLTTSTLADVTVAQAIGTYSAVAIDQLTACYRSIATAGKFVCVVFWAAGVLGTTNDATLGDSKVNTVDDVGTIGTQATFVAGLAPASRAFDVNGTVFVVMIYGLLLDFTGNPSLSQGLNSTYYLYREDRTLHGKAVAAAANDLLTGSTGVLPGVVFDGRSYAWGGGRRRRASTSAVAVSGLKKFEASFAARTPVDILWTFDSNEARRCARLGRTLYVSGGEILQYDGARLVEVGFSTWADDLLQHDAGAATGSMAAGTYAYKPGYRYINGVQETERSTSGAIGAVAVGTTASSTSSDRICALIPTRKTGVVVEIWRTQVNPDADSPFFLASSPDPTAITNPNRFLSSAPGAMPTFTDTMSDATIGVLEAHPENGAVLEDLAPPGAKIIFATETRLFLLGVSGDPDRGWYSKLRAANQVASFHDTLTFDVPHPGGAITSGFFDDNGTLYVARQTALYAFAGAGKDNLGGGTNFQLSRIVADDIGVVNHESVARTPRGVIFKSSKGWQLLLANGNLEFIGDKVSDFDGEAVLSVVVVETQHQVRILTAARMLVWDYRAGQWSPWTITDGVHACMANGAHVYLTATGTRTQGTTYANIDYGWDVETSWLKLADLQGAARCRKALLLGEQRDPCAVRVRVAYNYKQIAGVPTYVDDTTWIARPTVVGGPLQLKRGIKRPICESIKLRFTVGRLAKLFTTDLTIPLALVGPFSPIWTAILVASTTVTVTFALTGSEAAGTPTVEVRDNQVFDGTQWFAAPGTVGVAVTGGAGPTVGELEAAIGRSRLIQVSTPHATPADQIDIAAIDTIETTGTFLLQPFGEPPKLTGLALEVASEPGRGLFRRLPAGQQQ
jgi:hypothetical protein